MVTPTRPHHPKLRLTQAPEGGPDEADHRKIDQALAAGEQQLDSILSELDEVVWSIHPHTHELLYVNEAALRVYGRAVTEFLVNPLLWFEVVHPDDQAFARELLPEALKNGTSRAEYRIFRSDGDIRWLSVRARCIRGPAGEVIRIDGVDCDITERKRALDALHESQRRFRATLDNVELIALMLDRDARITYVNDHLLMLTGWRRDEVVGKNWFEIFIPTNEHLLPEVFRELIDDQPQAWHHENEILTRDGERRLVRWNNTVLRSPSGAVVGTSSIGEDVTERVAQERRIHRLNRARQVIASINNLVARVGERRELFEDACRIVFEQGGFRMVWIGLKDQDGRIEPIAVRGHDEGYIQAVLASSTAQSDGIARNILESGQPVLCNDIALDPIMAPWRDLALQRHYRSLACFPLRENAKTIGCLCLYSGDVGTFDAEEARLLEEASADISHALEFIARDERLGYLEFYDPVTRLANRKLFSGRLDDAVRAAHQARSRMAVLEVDLARFKAVNDTVGHSGGDEVLRMLAARLVVFAGNHQQVARSDSGRFILVLPNVDAGTLRGRLKDDLWPGLSQPYLVEGHEIRVGTRLGIAMFPDDGEDAASLLGNAEAALKFAKTTNDREVFYLTEMRAAHVEKLSLEGMLRRALERGEFVLHYQPKVNLRQRDVCGAEALLRWNSPDLGLVPPGRFVPLLEETGLIVEVGSWALQQAAADHSRWRLQGLPEIKVAVNVSPLQLRQPDFVETVAAATAGHDASGLQLEVTESMLTGDVERTIGKLQRIRAMGMDIAIDDFGTGYSSLAYLARLPVTTLKIDRSFIVAMTNSADTMAIVSTILSLAHALKMTVVAEGVDSEEQLKFLRLLRCDQVQGFIFSKGLPLSEFEDLLRSQRRL